MILDVYTDPTDQDDADDTRTDLIIQMPMIVTRTDALKNFDICQAGAVCGGRGNPSAESIKNAKYKIQKNITHTLPL